jgi:nucleoside-diphosphate-sugar epimerase
MLLLPSGASGVLGSAINDAFRSLIGHDIEVLALAHSRSGRQLVKLDLLDQPEVEKTIEQFKPDCKWILGAAFPLVVTIRIIMSIGVIHCAAERRPDVAEGVRQH